MIPYRNISVIERTYLFHETPDLTRMVINIVLEGAGSFNLEHWNEAIAKAAEKHPGSRLVKRAHLGFAKWYDTGIAPKARVVDFSHWDGNTSEGATIFNSHLSVNNGPTFEVLLLEGEPLRVCFRSHHGTMDAGGIMIFAKDVFRALRGEPVIGSNSGLYDIEFLKTLDGPPWPSKQPGTVAPTGPPRGEDLNCSWRILRVPGKQKGIMAKLALATQKSTLRFNQELLATADPVTRTRITVDLRRHLPNDIISTANLSSAFDVDIDELDTLESVTNKIKQSLDKRLECALAPPLLLKLAPWLPTKLTGMTDTAIRSTHQKGRYTRSGTLSNIGLIDRAEYSGGGFTTTSGIAIPPLFKLSPYFITSVGSVDSCNITVCVPNCLGNEGRLDQLTADIEESLVN